jgi:SAM-dependent methyltransferase
MTTRELVKPLLPAKFRRWLRPQVLRGEQLLQRLQSAPDFGSLGRVTPANGADFGGLRGQIIDRYYIENFLAAHASDVRGHVLEFLDDTYARRFGGARATQVDVLHRLPGNPQATLVADLASGEGIPSGAFDCVICTQVLQYVFDLQAAVRTIYRILRPGGTVLVTAPGIQRIDREEQHIEYWRFTRLALGNLFTQAFPAANVEAQDFGNVLAAVAFLHGFAVEDLRRQDLDYHDPEFQVLITLRAVKPEI